jgi:hypothetical protein
MFRQLTGSLKRRWGPMEQSDDRWEVCEHPMWLHPIFKFIKEHQPELKVGVMGLSMKTLRMVETEDDIQVPKMRVSTQGHLMLSWKFSAGAAFLYRYCSRNTDTGLVIVPNHHADHIRSAFRLAFNTNRVTEMSMIYHLGKRYQA